MQEEVLRRTRRLDERRGEGGELNPLEERLLERLVQRQGSIIELTEQIASDLQRQMQPPTVNEVQERPDDGDTTPDDKVEGEG